ncbi:Low temperature viability protein [Pseudomassariella vexata]|uniref:Low temperature viability protein n=1 Tax=Pseudomassariella vexata TaxID=1141098 RepID=A0A1Y2EK34_9PEZI|nr:Low temperature viability protein [Pseudomassariella vexata]ORY71654.1 Low temperature viability protein [Pseudomassariella vexata]
MPKGKWINKKTAQHFTLVHRPQNDPLIHDEAAPSMVLNPTSKPNESKGKKLDDLASEYGSQIRENEGEAAAHGVYFDDTEYDYMQHLRDLGTGTGGGDVVFVEADVAKDKGKGKQKQSLEDALRQIDLESADAKKRELLDEDFLPSKNLQRLTYQNQQEIPDIIRGFQPDMDPSLREVLEALEDEAYVDEEDDDIFQQLTKEGRELEDFEFGQFEDDDGWESDATAKPTNEFNDGNNDSRVPDLVSVPGAEEAEEEADQVGWLDDFKKFKQDQKTGRKPLGATPSQSDLQSSLMTTTTNGGRTKRRKGAMTSQSGYSMTSSSLVRTEQLGILDARFDKIEEEYNADMDDEMGSVSGVSAVSSVTGTVRSDFDGMLDEFLGNHSMRGKKFVRKTGPQSGIAELDEIRKELGPARFRTKSAKKTGVKS